MDKFWEWMEENCYFKIEQKEFTKQMLIDYMIEYINKEIECNALGFLHTFEEAAVDKNNYDKLVQIIGEK